MYDSITDFLGKFADAFVSINPWLWLLLVLVAAGAAAWKGAGGFEAYSWRVVLIPTYVVAACAVIWILIIAALLYGLSAM
jgi:hypothetical protein